MNSRVSFTSVTGANVFLTGLLVLALFVTAALSLRDTVEPELRQAPQLASSPRPGFRAALLILDSVGTSMAFDGELMPYIASLRSEALWGEATACPGNATFPCVKTLLEGRPATLGTTLQNFSASPSVQPSFPSSLAARGLRVAVASDHTLNRLYPGAYVDSFNYESLQLDLMARDVAAFQRAFRWLSDPTIDVAIVHVIGTDKVSHEYRVGGPEYRAKYRETDQFVRDVAARLGPNDYLFLLADHGHGPNGGHLRDAMYLMRGPAFPRGVRHDIKGADVLPLLSIPYGLPLPPSFEGVLRTDHLRLEPNVRQAYLETQAKLFSLDAKAGDADALEAQLNRDIAVRRANAGTSRAREDLVTLLPWLVAGLFFLLLSALRLISSVDSARSSTGFAWLGSGVARGAGAPRIATSASWVAPVASTNLGSVGSWVAPAAVLYFAARSVQALRLLFATCALLILGSSVFWLGPSWLGWFHQGPHRLSGTVIYLTAAAVLAVSTAWLWQRYGRADGTRTSYHRSIADTRELLELAQWILAVEIWLTSFFGVYFYSLTRLGPLVLLSALLLSVIVVGGLRGLLTPHALGLLALLPLMSYKAESYNVEFTELARLGTLSEVMRGLTLVVLAALLCIALKRRGQKFTTLWPQLVCLAAFIALCLFFFEFELTQVAGFLLLAIALSGMTKLIEHAGLAPRWTALCAAVCAYLAWCLALNGFALSRVDFRFAAELIVPLREELWRAVQLIAWAFIKYSFVLAPIFAIVARDAAAARVASVLAHLTWYRLALIALSALGLRLFGLPGVHELCSEEIYFWAALSVAFWLFAAALERKSIGLRQSTPSA